MRRSARRKPIVMTLNKALREVVQDKAVAEKLAGIETYLLPLDQATPEAHRAKLASQIACGRRSSRRPASRRSSAGLGPRHFVALMSSGPRASCARSSAHVNALDHERGWKLAVQDDMSATEGAVRANEPGARTW